MFPLFSFLAFGAAAIALCIGTAWALLYRRRRLAQQPPELKSFVELQPSGPVDKHWVPWAPKELPKVGMDWWASSEAYRADAREKMLDQ